MDDPSTVCFESLFHDLCLSDIHEWMDLFDDCFDAGTVEKFLLFYGCECLDKVYLHFDLVNP